MKLSAGVQAVLSSFLFLWLLAATGSAATGDTLVIDDFNAGLKPNWKIKTFKGQTHYSVIDQDGERVLTALSTAAASALVFEKTYSLRDYPVLSWRWKVANILAGGDARSKAGDDYPARIYVVFPHWFFPKTRSINYIWANKLPKGAHLPSSYTANSVMVAVQSGPEQVGRWIRERRNVRDDYRRIFGTEPPAAGAIAIMTDTDNTGGTARAWYDDIRLEKE
jgi:hypothetical protein